MPEYIGDPNQSLPNYSPGGNMGSNIRNTIGMPAPTYNAPTYTPPSPYVAPAYDEGRVTELTQQAAAPAVRGLRSAMQTASSANYDNPNVKRMTLRDALAGYGQGLQSAMSGANTTARGEYNTEYGIKADEGKTNYQTRAQASAMQYEGALSQAQMQYQTQWNAYLKEQEIQGNKDIAGMRYGGSSFAASNASKNAADKAYADTDARLDAEFEASYAGE